ncbi:MAG: endonuclease VIII [Chloroflexi bacterium]|nr:endonuclease VIII [Chloroflexota bacterium]
MPEGPEIRLAADALSAAIAGRVAESVFFAFDQLKQYEALLSGEVVTAVTSHGKAMLTHFANETTIYSHNQLYGIWMVRDAHDFPDTNRQLRLAIHNSEKSALLYSASNIEVWPTAELDAHPFLSKLGPDLLDDNVTVDTVAARFVALKFRRKRLTSLLLDQSFLAGLGNYLRTEILFVARVHPSLRPMDCTPAQIDALAQATVELTRQSYQTRGITNDVQLAEKLRKEGNSYKDYRFWVFRREDKSCYVCGTAVVRETLGGRRVFHCPTCQKLLD